MRHVLWGVNKTQQEFLGPDPEAMECTACVCTALLFLATDSITAAICGEVVWSNIRAGTRPYICSDHRVSFDSD